MLSRSRPGQQIIEPQRIIEREHAREPVFVCVVEIQARLQARDIAGCCAKGSDGLAQLIRLGPVFGVKDHREFTERERHRIIAGTGLCARHSRRHANDAEAWIANSVRDGGGLCIVFLDHQFYVQAILRIIQRAERADESRDDVRLAIEWNENGINRQPIFRNGRSRFACHPLIRADPEQHRTKYAVRNEQNSEKNRQYHAGELRNREQQQRKANSDDREDLHLAAR